MYFEQIRDLLEEQNSTSPRNMRAYQCNKLCGVYPPRSSSLNDRVEKVSNSDVVAEDLRLDAVDLALLLADLLLKFSKRVL